VADEILGPLVASLIDVDDVEDRLCGQRRQLPEGVRGGLGQGHPAGGPPRAQRLGDLLEPGMLGDRRLVARTRLLRQPLESALGALEVGGEQLRLDQLRVGEGVDAAVGMGDLGGGVGSDHVADRVGFADRGEKAVPESLALRSPPDEPGDVVELDRLPDDGGRAEDLGDLVEALVGDLDHGDVRLDRGERVVADLGRGRGEGVEQGRLARVRKADDPDLHGSGTSSPKPVPRRAPPSTSEG
jgi:hypothetical protein